MSVQFKFNFADTPGLTAQHDQLLNELNSAAAEWTKGLKGDGTVVVAVREGTFADGTTSRTDAEGYDSGQVDSQGKHVWMPYGELQANPHGVSLGDDIPAAMVMTLDLQHLAAKPDPVSFLAHAIGSGLGCEGWITDSTQSSQKVSSYDVHVHPEDGAFVFDGQHAGHVPLSQHDPYVLAVAGPDVLNAPRAGATVTSLDFAVLADIGYEIDPGVLPPVHDFGDLPSG